MGRNPTDVAHRIIGYQHSARDEIPDDSSTCCFAIDGDTDVHHDTCNHNARNKHYSDQHHQDRSEEHTSELQSQ